MGQDRGVAERGKKIQVTLHRWELDIVKTLAEQHDRSINSLVRHLLKEEATRSQLAWIAPETPDEGASKRTSKRPSR